MTDPALSQSDREYVIRRIGHYARALDCWAAIKRIDGARERVRRLDDLCGEKVIALLNEAEDAIAGVLVDALRREREVS